VKINGEFNAARMPVLLLSNHFSWWDGFFAAYLNTRIFHKKFHIMMEEKQLQQYMFFNRAGAYSIRKKTYSVIESLDYTNRLLADSSNLVVIFPQGRIESAFQPVLTFEKGVERILKNVKNEIQVVFVINLVEYFSDKKPSLYSYIHEYKPDQISFQVLMRDFNAFYVNCRAAQNNHTIGS
jgi:1-acyl-sn-glycerol-3-phosphate acyltransferase